MSVQQKSTLITGAGKGFGLALAKAFLREGWVVFALVRNHEDASKFKESNPKLCKPIISDITSETVGIEVEKALRPSGAIDVLINNAGVGGLATSIETTSAAEIEALFNVHCLGVLRVTQAAMPYMRSNGKVINNGNALEIL